MEMTLKLSEKSMTSEVQSDFNRMFPYLKIRFYMPGRDGQGRKLLGEPLTLEDVGLKKPGTLRIEEEMTVGELEKEFLESFGMLIQVSRRSGSIWLETTMTDSWTLSRQNEHGRELTQ